MYAVQSAIQPGSCDNDRRGFVDIFSLRKCNRFDAFGQTIGSNWNVFLQKNSKVFKATVQLLYSVFPHLQISSVVLQQETHPRLQLRAV